MNNVERVKWIDQNGELLDWQLIEKWLGMHLTSTLFPLILQYLTLYMNVTERLGRSRNNTAGTVILSEGRLAIQSNKHIIVYALCQGRISSKIYREPADGITLKFLYGNGFVGFASECMEPVDVSFTGSGDKWKGGWDGDQHQFQHPFYAYKFERNTESSGLALFADGDNDDKDEDPSIIGSFRVVPMETKQEHNVIRLFRYTELGKSPLRDDPDDETTLHCFPNSESFKLMPQMVYSLEINEKRTELSLLALKLSGVDLEAATKPDTFLLPPEICRSLLETHIRIEKATKVKRDNGDWSVVPVSDLDLLVHLDIMYETLIPFTHQKQLRMLDTETQEWFTCASVNGEFLSIHFNDQSVAVIESEEELMLWFHE